MSVLRPDPVPAIVNLQWSLDNLQSLLTLSPFHGRPGRTCGLSESGGHADPNDQGAQDWADAQALYTILEQQVVPTFYDRGPDGIPRRWLQVVRQSIRTVLPRFSARRMVKEYVTRMYAPAAAAGGRGQ